MLDSRQAAEVQPALGPHLLADELGARGSVPQVQQRAHRQGEAEEGRGEAVLVAGDVLHKLRGADGNAWAQGGGHLCFSPWLVLNRAAGMHWRKGMLRGGRAAVLAWTATTHAALCTLWRNCRMMALAHGLTCTQTFVPLWSRTAVAGVQGREY